MIFGYIIKKYPYYLQKKRECLLHYIIGVDERHKGLGEGERVADEGGELAVVRLAGEDTQLLAQLLAPVHAQIHEILNNKIK